MAYPLSIMGDSRQKVTDKDILRLLKSGFRPVWTTSRVAEKLDVTRQTANNRLQQLESESKEVASINVGRATAYYIPGVNPLPPGETDKERHKQSIVQWATDKFVGLESAPWTAVHPNDGPAEGGDKIQFLVRGAPGDWGQSRTWTWENRPDELHPGLVEDSETQALVSGSLYTKPTTPIEHIPYDNHGPDWDLEMHIGINEIETDRGDALIATGVRRHWIRPENDAVFLTDVEIVDISPRGEGQELETYGYEVVDDEAEGEIIDEADDIPDEYWGEEGPGL